MLKFIIVLLLTGFLWVQDAHAVDIYVIANVNNHMTKTLTYTQIEDIFTLRSRKWGDGHPIKVFLLPREDARTLAFTSKYLNMTPARYFDIIESQESAGKGNISLTVSNEYEIIIKILTTPGSIGYASDSVIFNNGDAILIVK